MIAGCPTFSNTGSGETLTNSNRQQDYKAYSLGIFRGKCLGFVRFYVPGNNRFSQVPYSENVRFWQTIPGYVK